MGEDEKQKEFMFEEIILYNMVANRWIKKFSCIIHLFIHSTVSLLCLQGARGFDLLIGEGRIPNRDNSKRQESK